MRYRRGHRDAADRVNSITRAMASRQLQARTHHRAVKIIYHVAMFSQPIALKRAASLANSGRGRKRSSSLPRHHRMSVARNARWISTWPSLLPRQRHAIYSPILSRIFCGKTAESGAGHEKKKKKKKKKKRQRATRRRKEGL